MFKFTEGWDTAPRTEGNMKVTKKNYKCSDDKCGAVDTVKLFSNEVAPVAINCHACKAGMKTDLNVMLQQGVGMYPVEGSK